MNSQTAGPWDADLLTLTERGLGNCYVIWDATNNIRVALVPKRKDARLIAAAPELLDSLKEIIALTDRKTDIWDKARAVIAKAEGLS